MKKVLFSLLIGALSVSGCALKLMPEPTESGVINSRDLSQTVTKDGIAITVRGADAELYTYNLEGTVTAFTVLIENRSAGETAFDTDAFLLVDDEGRQHYPLTPEKVKEIISRDSYYLIPYPYVGFYYLEDYEKSSFYNRFNTQLPYFYELYPQDIYTKALPGGTIIPQAKVGGFVYFKIDLSGKKGVKLLVFRKGTPKSAAPDFLFPFKIQK